jgi:hypothetical protein
MFGSVADANNREFIRSLRGDMLTRALVLK